MTREEALKIWLPVIKMGVESMQECSEALDMAIKALEQEPCGDAISREAAVDACLNGWNKDYKEIVAEIRALPHVTPQYTDTEIQKMQDLEFAEIQKAYEIGKAENPNKWIPVSERLPEQDKSGCSNWHSVKVFAQIKSYTGKTEIVKGCFIEFGDVMAFELDEYPLCIPDGWDVITLDKDNRAYNEEYPEEYVELQAWMPLPDPYKASPTGAERSDKE